MMGWFNWGCKAWWVDNKNEKKKLCGCEGGDMWILYYWWVRRRVKCEWWNQDEEAFNAQLSYTS